MITNSNNYTIKPWKQIGNRSSDENNFNNTEYSYKIEKTDFHYDNASNTNSDIPAEKLAVYVVNGNEKEPKQNTLDHSNEYIGITESVVFERIFPKAAKKLWPQTADPSNNTDKVKLKMNHNQKFGKRISTEYGDAILSHDLAREERQKSEPPLVKNDSVSESPELPIARNKWGVKLRHVKRDDLDDRDYSIKSSTSVQNEIFKSTGKTRPFSLIEGQLSKNHHQSTESSNFIEKDFSDSCIVDVKKLNEQTTEVKNLSVNERRKTFEKNTKNSTKIEQIRHSALPSRISPRRNSFHGAPTAFFYQGPMVDDISNSSPQIPNIRSPVERKNPVSLEDLLKIDEMKLTFDVLNKPTSPGKIQSPNEVLDVNANIISPIHKLNGRAVLDDKSKVFDFNQTDDTVLTLTPENKPDKWRETKESIAIKPSSDGRPISNVHQQKTKIVRKIFATAVNDGVNPSTADTSTKGLEMQPSVPRPTKLPVSIETNQEEKKKYLDSSVKKSSNGNDFSIDVKQTKSPATSAVSSGIRYNKLGQVILNKKEPEFLKSSIPEGSLNSSEISKEMNKKQIPKNEGKINSNKLNNKPDRHYDVFVSAADNEVLTSTVKHQNNLKTQNSIVPQISDQKVSPAQPLPSLSQQKRRVGKLIIMTGDQRDEQLRSNSKKVSMETSTNGVRQVMLKKEIVDSAKNVKPQENPMNGFSLTFVSNELDDVDDDPNAQPPVVPKVVFNEPVSSIKSILSSGVNRNKNKKKKRISFSTSKLATVHSYPSESSFYEETKAGNSVTSVSLSGLSAYQPSTVADDIGSVIQRERDRYTGPIVHPKLQEPSPNVNFSYSTEGDHFNTHYNQEGGQALLF